VTRRLAVVLAVLAAAVIAVVPFVRGSDGAATGGGPAQHRIDLTAVVESVTTDIGWTMDGGRTVKAARFTLDDTRVLTVADGTLVAAAGPVPACTDFVTPRACVLLADLLGEAIVRFALVPANTATPAATLELPGLVDMQANGDEGILGNGWVVDLASPTERRCTDVPTSNLREFITKFPGDKSRSIVDLTSDAVVRVECAA